MESWKCGWNIDLDISRNAVLLPSCDRFPSLFDLLENSLVRNIFGADFHRLLFEGDVIFDAFCQISRELAERSKMNDGIYDLKLCRRRDEYTYRRWL